MTVVTNFKSASDTIDITAPKTKMTNSGQCRDLPTLFYSRWYKIANPLCKLFAKVTNQKRTRLVAGFLSLCVRDTFWLAGNWSKLFFWKRKLVTTLTCSFSFLSSKITKMGSTSFTRGPPLHLVYVKSKSCKVIEMRWDDYLQRCKTSLRIRVIVNYPCGNRIGSSLLVQKVGEEPPAFMNSSVSEWLMLLRFWGRILMKNLPRLTMHLKTCLNGELHSMPQSLLSNFLMLCSRKFLFISCQTSHDSHRQLKRYICASDQHSCILASPSSPSFLSPS